MVYKLKCLCFQAYSIIVLGSLVWSLADFAAAQTVKLSGTVKDHTGAAFSGTAIQVINPSTQQVIGSTLTDPNGAYQISISPGIYDVEAVPPASSGFQTSTALNQSILTDTILNFVLVPSGSALLSGRVLDTLGNGVPNQRIALAPAGSQSWTEQTTGPDGSYAFQVAPGDYQIRMYPYDFARSLNIPRYYWFETNWGSALSLTQSIILDLRFPAKRVTVHVQDPAGNPVSNVGLTTDSSWNSNLNFGPWSVSGYSLYPTWLAPELTDGNGNATLWLFPNGSTPYTLTATPPPGAPIATFHVSNVLVVSDMSIIVVLQFARQPQPQFCPLSQGFWKNHPEAWPVTSLTLGNQSYSSKELLTLLKSAVKGDASILLAHQLIAAKLNIAMGSDAAVINRTVADVDNLLSAFSGKLPYRVKPSSASGESMVQAAEKLDQYNNGDLTPTCTPQVPPAMRPTSIEVGIGTLKDKVSVLVQDGTLTVWQGKSLSPKLKAAQRHVNRDHRRPAANALRAFVNEVQAFLNSRKLTLKQAEPLLNAANLIIAVLEQ